MSSSQFSVWGFGGELQGNEDRLQARLPMFCAEGKSDVFLARTLDWSGMLPESDVVRMPAGRAAEYGEQLQSELSVPIEPRQYVIVFGPRMRERLLARNIPVIAYPVQNGFGFAVMHPETFKAYATIIEKRARREFDAAVHAGVMTDAARDALAIMRNSGVGQLRDHLLRTLVLHKLTGDADQFRRVLRLASRRLGDEPEQLKKSVDEHVEFVCSSAPAVPGVFRRKLHTRGGISFRPQIVHKVEPSIVHTDLRVDKINPKKSFFYGTVHHPLVSQKSLFPSLPSVTINDSQELTNWIVSEE